MWEAISKFHTEKKLEVRPTKVFLFSFSLSKQTLGELLDINFRSVYDVNKTAIMTKAALFGLSWLGNGATIKKMPLINMLVMCGDKPPAVISICDCTDHMVEGGKKDAEFIMNFFKEKVDEFDPSKVHTDSFFFDGAANVQKAGQILCAHFPRAMCFHGGEHVLSLFFSDLSRLGAIKVSFFSFFYFSIFS